MPFVHHELRTTDVEVGRAFYLAVLGRELPVVPLPDRARQAGAPSHWLGYLGPLDVDATLARWTALGAVPLGPRTATSAVVRDPGGATVALTDKIGTPPDLVYASLHTGDLSRALAAYRGLVGLDIGPVRDEGSLALHPFRCHGEEPGAIVDVAGRAGVHPHWLFHFPVRSIDEACRDVESAGGELIGRMGGATRAAICHDPTGAIFAIAERSPH